MTHYQVVAQNYSQASENRIHSDEIAKKYGFRGALVPGVAVYGHLTYLLAKELGSAWLGHSIDNLRLLKPAYHNEKLTLTLTSKGSQHTVQCLSPAGELIATLDSTMPTELPDSEPADLFEKPPKNPERVEISWDTIEVETPFTPWNLSITQEINQRYAREVSDNLALYENKAVHPHLLLGLANRALTNEYLMPTWIHAGSETRHRAQVNVGDTLTIKSVPLEKWQNKGHEFIRLYVSYWRGEELTTDIMHTAIYKLAE